ncbi:hypothetical protein L873DRAFT_137128 [Choiromyces venosus 120613-1]|uniref:Uncharacterized protein n=1 Tax=Choiromyces venosus 120613-1 TaxID=1336337 RepID=A0A3N4J6F5_9PEZI|nr:hypothetical protein L873DRAFT_137128 [Choiromyces venosus 120613-1]
MHAAVEGARQKRKFLPCFFGLGWGVLVLYGEREEFLWAITTALRCPGFYSICSAGESLRNSETTTIQRFYSLIHNHHPSSIKSPIPHTTSPPLQKKKMDPNCAICNSPPKHSCDCERRSLIHAVEESERRVLSPLIADIRRWVTTQARASIHQDFRAREARRRTEFERWRRESGRRLEHWELEELLQRGASEDWRAAVERYPDVLDYFYGMVGWSRNGGGGGGSGDGVRRGRGGCI